MSEIIMYARERFCPDVTRARTRLEHHGIGWTEFEVEANETMRTQMEQFTGKPNVPQLHIGERILIEPSIEEIDDALVAAGFDLSDE
jgi:glutaredoxin